MKVRWEIDIDDAATREEAAVKAFLIMQRRRTTANVFDVDDDKGDVVRIDLLQIGPDAAVERMVSELERDELVYYVLAILGDGPPVSEGPFPDRMERNTAARSMWNEAGSRLTALYSVELSPVNFDVHRLTESDLEEV